MASVVRAAPAAEASGVLADGTVDEEFEDASQYPVPSGNGLGCKGAGLGLCAFSSAVPVASCVPVVTSAAFPLLPMLALLTRRLSSPSSFIECASERLPSSTIVSSKKASGYRGLCPDGEGVPQDSGMAALEAYDA